ncbi:TetR/AcrR family transcriptional regulator [Pseudorhodoplanes sp.]|uniref:TetR/AcrR family transcriptional regulator n=1 Tax=Pseudorhodoplanes sp. TaxID=1934341 RepID=UPI003D0CE7F7
MAQVKKARIRDAIIESAYRLFRKQSYLGTSIAQIGRAAGIAPSNVYVYFNSKFEIFYAVYEPWLKRRFARLERQLSEIPDPDGRLLHILRTVWLELPVEDNGFANNLMQAVSTTGRDEPYRSDLLSRSESALSELLRRALPARRHVVIEHDRLAHILLMAFDGFVVRHHVGGTRPDMEEIANIMKLLIVGGAVVLQKKTTGRPPPRRSAPARASRRRKTKAVVAG